MSTVFQKQPIRPVFECENGDLFEGLIFKNNTNCGNVEFHKSELKKVPQVYTPNQTTYLSNTRSIKYIVIHYTGGDLTPSLSWLCNPQAQASAHLFISRTGDVFQMVNFKDKAWHAGKSYWNGDSNLNNLSIGIELENCGYAVENRDDLKKTFLQHKNESQYREWEVYPDAQLDTLIAVCRCLVDKYPTIKTIVGHDDIAPARKVDPGPAFPNMSLFQEKVFGRGGHDEEEDFKTKTKVYQHVGHLTANTNLRSSRDYAVRDNIITVLPKGCEVIIETVDESHNWYSITTEVFGKSYKGFVYASLVNTTL